MIECKNTKEINYFHHDYENDFPQSKSQFLRVTQVALPFLSLYAPLGRVIAVGTSFTRLGTAILQCHHNRSANSLVLAKSLLEVAISISAAVGSIFLHPVGMMISTGHDMCINSYNIYKGAQNRDAFAVAKACAKLAANSFYLLALIYGTLEIQVASLGALAISGAVCSLDEYRKGHWLEAGAEMLMAAIRVHQLVPKWRLLQQKYKMQQAAKRVYVKPQTEAVLDSLKKEFLKAEANQPAEGYSVHLSYNKAKGELSGRVEKVGKRSLKTELEMPEIHSCPFCDRTNSISFSSTGADCSIVHSRSDRILLVPNAHIPHWFTKDAPQTELITTGIKVCETIESEFKDILTTDGCYEFELHVGSAAGQTVPHLHLRFEGGENQGILTERQWEWFNEKTQ